MTQLKVLTVSLEGALASYFLVFRYSIGPVVISLPILRSFLFVTFGLVSTVVREVIR